MRSEHGARYGIWPVECWRMRSPRSPFPLLQAWLSSSVNSKVLAVCRRRGGTEADPARSDATCYPVTPA
ncbi:hypothetical protein PGIGA_G00222500 [Pangasianodon gigas]|uniref:Uncharacterized protein n=1 Tax=Pangasianodon gigas TaxID=30993 RepID=A0ACC5WIU9_PANGG|nr:hypothetical protein [Pangasianodon gigas]